MWKVASHLQQTVSTARQRHAVNYNSLSMRTKVQRKAVTYGSLMLTCRRSLHLGWDNVRSSYESRNGFHSCAFNHTVTLLSDENLDKKPIGFESRSVKCERKCASRVCSVGCGRLHPVQASLLPNMDVYRTTVAAAGGHQIVFCLADKAA